MNHTSQHPNVAHCQIDARLHNGKPALEIIDASNGHVRMAWCSDNALAETTPDDLKSLFRDLMLLSTVEQLALYPVALPHNKPKYKPHN